MSELDLLIDPAQEAGALALRLRSAGLTVTAKLGGSPVTDGDLAIDALLKDRLLKARPDYGWLSGETADSSDRLTRRALFVVDPIDGTTAYLHGTPWFSISIAVVEDGRPVTGVVCAPALNQVYSARSGGIPHLNGHRSRSRAETDWRAAPCWQTRAPWPPPTGFQWRWRGATPSP